MWTRYHCGLPRQTIFVFSLLPGDKQRLQAKVKALMFLTPRRRCCFHFPLLVSSAVRPPSSRVPSPRLPRFPPPITTTTTTHTLTHTHTQTHTHTPSTHPATTFTTTTTTTTTTTHTHTHTHTLQFFYFRTPML